MIGNFIRSTVLRLDLKCMNILVKEKEVKVDNRYKKNTNSIKDFTFKLYLLYKLQQIFMQDGFEILAEHFLMKSQT